MKKFKNILIAAVLIAAALTAAYFLGGDAPSTDGKQTASSISKISNEAYTEGNKPPESENATKTKSKLTAEEKIQLAEKIAEESTEIDSPKTPEAAPKDEVIRTAPTQNSETDENTEYTCTLSVRCDTLLSNMQNLNPEKRDIIPSDGIILEKREVVFYEGETVFHVLLREMKKNKIHMEFVNTPIYKSAYIEGIANIYELDCGELSGWMYRVNGVFPSYGCSRCKLKPGDNVEWVYTCNLGIDVGGYFSDGGSQKDE